jgi:hypothetical protein
MSQTRETRLRWIERGLCQNCGARPPYPERKLCEICLRTQREGRRKFRADNPGEFRGKYHSRKKAGVCTRCGLVAPRPNYNLCTICNAAERQRSVRVKKKVMDKYGGQCICCGETHIAFLTLDHINDDGGQRRSEGVGTQLYQRLLKLPVDSTLRVLCYNCNCGRRTTGMCPHQDDGYFVKALAHEKHAHTRPEWGVTKQLVLPFWSVQFARKRTRLEIQLSAEKALLFIKAHPNSRTEVVRKHMQLTHKTWNYLLGYLRKAGKVQTTGITRGMTIHPT